MSNVSSLLRRTDCGAGCSGVGHMVTKNDSVFSIGLNVQGCLGEKKLAVAHIPVKIQSLCGQEVKDFYAGFGHVIELTNDGRLFGWGDNKFLQLGQRNCDKTDKKLFRSTKTIAEPVRIAVILEWKTVTSVACGFNHSLALTSDGLIYGWGYNKDGRVGCGSKETLIDEPTKVPFPSSASKIKSISCGRHFSAALSEDGHIFVWGHNDYGQLGMKDTSMLRAPKKLNVSTALFVQIACGPFHGLALTRSNQVFFWGHHMLQRTASLLNKSLPKSEDHRKWLPPLRIADDLEPIVEIAASFLVPISVMRNCTGVHVMGRCFGKFWDTPLKTHFGTTAEAFAYCPDIPVMHRSMQFETVCDRLADVWERALNDKDSSDIDFHIDDHVLKAHILFLRIRSPHLCTQLDISVGKDCEIRLIELEDIKFSLFHAFLRYLYTDKVELECEDDVRELLKLAHQYQQNDLHARCQEILKSTVTLQNLVPLYRLSVDYDVQNLRNNCLDFVAENYADDGEKRSKGKTLIRSSESTTWADMLREIKSRKK